MKAYDRGFGYVGEMLNVQKTSDSRHKNKLILNLHTP
jgi:hypothetical protein